MLLFPTLRGLFSGLPHGTFLILQVCATRQSCTPPWAQLPGCGAVKGSLFLSGLPVPGLHCLPHHWSAWPSALHIDNQSLKFKFSSRTVLKTWVYAAKLILTTWLLLWKTSSVNDEINVLQFRKAPGCILVSNSVACSGWLPEGEGAFCLYPTRVEDSTARKNQAECAFKCHWQMVFLPSVMTTHVIKFTNSWRAPGFGWPCSVNHPFTCFSFYIFRKAKAKITEASFPKDTF